MNRKEFLISWLKKEKIPFVIYKDWEGNNICIEWRKEPCSCPHNYEEFDETDKSLSAGITVSNPLYTGPTREVIYRYHPENQTG